MDSPSLINAAKLIAVPLPLFLAGYSTAFSQNAVPLIYDQPAEVSTPVFKGVFTLGAYMIVPGAVLSTTAASYLAYVLPAQRYTWTTSAVAAIAPLLWTQTVMFSGIKRLIAISGSKEMMEKASANLEHRQLLSRWVKQNTVRAALYLVSGIAALRATMGA